MFCYNSGLCPLMLVAPSSTPLSKLWQFSVTARHCQMFAEWQKQTWLRTVTTEEQNCMSWSKMRVELQGICASSWKSLSNELYLPMEPWGIHYHYWRKCNLSVWFAHFPPFRLLFNCIYIYIFFTELICWFSKFLYRTYMAPKIGTLNTMTNTIVLTLTKPRVR